MTDSRADIDVDVLTKQFDAFCADNLPSDVLRQIHEMEQGHLAQLSHTHGRFISQFEASYDILVRILAHVNYGADRAKWPGHRIVQFIIANENLKPIYSAFDKLVRGYPEDSFTLARVAYEAFLRIVFISLYPQVPGYSFGDQKGVRKFNATNLVEQDLRLDRWNHYSILSAMVHSYKFPVLKKLVDIGKHGQREPLVMSFDYDETLLEVGINILKFLVFIYLRLASEILLQPRKPNAVDAELLNKVSLYIDLESRCFMSHPKKDWQTVVGDLDYVFDMVRAVDNDEDWKNIREVMRGS